MKKALNLGMAALILMTSLAQAGCVREDRGNPHPDGDPGWSRKIITQRANNTWQDWIWRGQDHPGVVYHCSWSNAKPECDYAWNQTATKEWSWGVGGGVMPGGYPQDWFKKVFGGLLFNFNADFRKSRSTSQSFNIVGSGRRGQFIEPIIVVVRRWSRGHFNGGWVFTGNKTLWIGGGRTPIPVTGFCYDYNGGINFGAWETNLSQGNPYRTYHIHW